VTAASKAERLGTGLDDSVLFVDDAVIDEEILVAERNAALRAAFAELPPRCQQLLSMLLSDPPHSYVDIHRELGIPIGSIGPQRARCLERMRRSSAFAWHNIEAELAQLTYDSNEDRLQVAVMRSETASIRALTFTSAHLSVELEVTGNSLLGQLLPAREGELEIHTRAGEISTTAVDDIGCFSIDPIPDSPFRLRCRT